MAKKSEQNREVVITITVKTKKSISNKMLKFWADDIVRRGVGSLKNDMESYIITGNAAIAASAQLKTEVVEVEVGR